MVSPSCGQVAWCSVKKQRNQGTVATVTQNQRMVGIGRSLQRSSSPTPMIKQVCLYQVMQEPMQMSFGNLQRRRLH